MHRVRSTPFLVTILLLSGFALPACKPKQYMNPAPFVLNDGAFPVFDDVPPGLDSNDIPVIYVTGRMPDRKNGELVGFTIGEDSDLRAGAAIAQFGPDDLDWDTLVERSTSDDPGKTLLTLKSFDDRGVVARAGADGPFGVGPDGQLTQGARELIDVLDRTSATSNKGQVLIYVHGYNNDFEWSIGTGAQLEHFLGRTEPVIVWAWPATVNALAYGSDMRRARRSAPDLARLVEFIATHTTVRQVDFLGYSAGAAVVADAIRILHDKAPDADRQTLLDRYRVGQVVLVGADIDFNEFTTEHLPACYDVAKQTTFYMADNDVALGVSSLLNMSARVGRPPAIKPEELARLQAMFPDSARIEAIDATSSRGRGLNLGSGHDYWLHDPWIFSDVLVLLGTDRTAPERGLALKEGTKATWYFPPDFPERMNAIIREARAGGK